MDLHTNKCVFLDRDGVLNEDCPNYVYSKSDLIIPDGVVEALQALKQAGFLLIVITNQAGIAKGMYGEDNVFEIHEALQEASGGMLDDLYFSPYHPQYSGASLSRKPGSLMLEKAISKYSIDASISWMVGDRDRDMQAGRNAGLKTIHIVTGTEKPTGDFSAANLLEASKIILEN